MQNEDHDHRAHYEALERALAYEDGALRAILAVNDLVEAGRPIQAIKGVREATSLDLHEAKNLVKHGNTAGPHRGLSGMTVMDLRNYYAVGALEVARALEDVVREAEADAHEEERLRALYAMEEAEDDYEWEPDYEALAEDAAIWRSTPPF